MHARELEQRGDAIEEAHQQKPIERRGVPDFGQIGARVQTDGGQRQHGGDAQADTVAGRLAMDPEGHPGQDDDQNAWDVYLDGDKIPQKSMGIPLKYSLSISLSFAYLNQKVAGQTVHIEGHLQYRKVTFTPSVRIVALRNADQIELAECHAGHKGHRIAALPLVDERLRRVGILREDAELTIFCLNIYYWNRIFRTAAQNQWTRLAVHREVAQLHRTRCLDGEPH